jgi:D-glycero-alpha-D-manno-heptose-7-phosphate kinase
MIISKTPLRMSLFGGGTDMNYFSREFGGCVLSLTIDKYVYVAVHDRFEANYRISYSSQEYPEEVSQIRHPIIREVLSTFPTGNTLEINSIAEIPSSGSGLGSSSAFTVGLLNSLLHKSGLDTSPENLAQVACQIEIDNLSSPIGKQDQYAVAFGGFNLISFHKDDSVSVDKVKISEEKVVEFFENFQLFFTGVTRDANVILASQQKDYKKDMTLVDNLLTIKNQVLEGKNLIESGSYDDFGLLLNEAWRTKKKLNRGISNDLIDQNYSRAIEAGALGGKLLGAGGGGFLLVYTEKRFHCDVAKALSSWREIPIAFEPKGSQVFEIGGSSK